MLFHILFLAFHKFFEPDRHFTLKMGPSVHASYVHNHFSAPNLSRTLMLYCTM